MTALSIFPEAGSNGMSLNAPPPGTPLLHWKLTQELPLASGPREAMQEVIEDEAAFRRFWGLLYPTRAYRGDVRQPAMPNIDFSREVVVVVALGQRSSGGFAIETNVTQGNGRVEVAVHHYAPGPYCIVTQLLTAPFVVLRMPKPSDPIVFLTRETIHACPPSTQSVRPEPQQRE